MDSLVIEDRPRKLLENVCGFTLGAMPSGLSMLAESNELECIAGRSADRLITQSRLAEWILELFFGDGAAYG